jgi:hypothetical protein
MHYSRILPTFLALFPVAALAVYAPIPEQDQGKAWSYRIGASVYHDSNIFGAATSEIDSMVYRLEPSISFNSSVTDQTFLSFGYDLMFDHVADRPGKQNLTSHDISARVAHKFTNASTFSVREAYSISKNPASLLAGVPLNTDQSLKHNQFDLNFETTAGQKTNVLVKYRNLDFAYDSATLSTQLDRMEHLAGLEVNFAMLPETRLVGEYRHQRIGYDNISALKDKTSNFLLGGVEHKPNAKTRLSGRAGLEDRERDGGDDTVVPYIELSLSRDYAEGSFISGGYVYTLEEPSDVLRFSDNQVNRLFVNLQHRISAFLNASGSITYEPSQLQGRGGQVDIEETTTRFGLGLSYLPTKNWLVSATFDLDRVDSDDIFRGQDRTRLGLMARFSY